MHPISATLFPTRKFEKLTIQQQGDVLQLAEHKINGWDYFVTNNSRDFSRHKEALRELGIVVLSPEETVQAIASLVAAGIFGRRHSAKEQPPVR